MIEARRKAELKADQMAIAAMAKAGYDPASLAAYIRRAQPETVKRYSTLSPRETRLSATER